jgi:transcriptional regulator with XRE-family HTH domain
MKVAEAIKQAEALEVLVKEGRAVVSDSVSLAMSAINDMALNRKPPSAATLLATYAALLELRRSVRSWIQSIDALEGPLHPLCTDLIGRAQMEAQYLLEAV